jgi:hypothetical protein
MTDIEERLNRYVPRLGNSPLQATHTTESIEVCGGPGLKFLNLSGTDIFHALTGVFFDK